MCIINENHFKNSKILATRYAVVIFATTGYIFFFWGTLPVAKRKLNFFIKSPLTSAIAIYLITKR